MRHLKSQILTFNNHLFLFIFTHHHCWTNLRFSLEFLIFFLSKVLLFYFFLQFSHLFLCLLYYIFVGYIFLVFTMNSRCIHKFTKSFCYSWSCIKLISGVFQFSIPYDHNNKKKTQNWVFENINMIKPKELWGNLFIEKRTNFEKIFSGGTIFGVLRRRIRKMLSESNEKRKEVEWV